MSQYFVRAVAIGVALASTACVRVTSTSFAPSATVVNPDSVRIFAVNRPSSFTEVAILRSHRFLVSDTKVLDALRKRAAAMGANGLLLINAGNSGTQQHSGSGIIIGGPGSGGIVVGDGETKIDAFERAVAIRF